jgi:hypothetical protein
MWQGTPLSVYKVYELSVNFVVRSDVRSPLSMGRAMRRCTKSTGTQNAISPFLGYSDFCSSPLVIRDIQLLERHVYIVDSYHPLSGQCHTFGYRRSSTNSHNRNVGIDTDFMQDAF